MMGVFSHRRGGLLLTATAILLPMAAHAQSTNQGSSITLPAVQVQGQAETTSTAEEYLEKGAESATKTNTPVLETPQSITTITRRQIDDQNPQTVKEALNYTAGVISSADTTSRYDSVFMRGFGGFGTSTRVVDYLDGLKLPRGQAFALPSIDPFLLDRVEVLKGPSAVLYGQTSPGGLINQVSRAPTATTYNEARLEMGTDMRMQGGYTGQGAFDKDGHWQYSVAGFGRRADTRYDDVEEQRIAVSPALKWAPNDDTSLTLRAYYQYDPEGGYFNSIYPKSLAPDAYKSSLSRDLNVGDPDFDSYEREQYGLGYSFDHRFNDWVSISSDTRYSAIDLDFQSLQMSGAITAAGLLPRQAAHSVEFTSGISTDNKATFEFSTGAIDHTTLVGLDYQRSYSTWDYSFGGASSLNVTNPTYGVAVGALTQIVNNKQTLEQTGAYLQDQISYGGFRTVLGVRYDWTDQVTENRMTTVESHQSSESASYRVGVLYAFDNGIAPYASYSTSFEPTVGVDVSGKPFDPTEATQWELGVKYEPTSVDALFTASLFHIRQENVLVASSVVGFNTQEGETLSRGVEFEARGQATENLELIGALTLLDTEVSKSTVAANVGKRPQAAPLFYGSAWANYRFDGSELNGALKGFTLGSGIRFAGDSYADSANTVSTDGYVLVDLAASYDLAQVSSSLNGATATLNVTNLLDKEYYSSCSSNFYCQYGNGAQAVAGVRYTW
jgi:iron complex outermembrane receptor protein